MKYLYTARYGAMSEVADFIGEVRLRRRDLCVLKSNRGTELGEIVVKKDEVQDEDTENSAYASYGKIIRRAMPDDVVKNKEIETEIVPKEYKFCADKIKEHNLPMRIVFVEHLFGGDKIVFYFTSDERVDFRELVKDLAKEYKTRIEMKQIGVRDKARLLGYHEHCGRPLCCKGFMKELEPVTMKMAKAQKMTLDPAKISGACGRLMCCLRFEDELYTQYKEMLPKKGSVVRTKKVKGEVLDYSILQQLITIEDDDGEKHIIHLKDIIEVVSSGDDLKVKKVKRKVEDEKSE